MRKTVRQHKQPFLVIKGNSKKCKSFLWLLSYNSLRPSSRNSQFLITLYILIYHHFLFFLHRLISFYFFFSSFVFFGFATIGCSNKGCGTNLFIFTVLPNVFFILLRVYRLFYPITWNLFTVLPNVRQLTIGTMSLISRKTCMKLVRYYYSDFYTAVFHLLILTYLTQVLYDGSSCASHNSLHELQPPILRPVTDGKPFSNVVLTVGPKYVENLWHSTVPQWSWIVCRHDNLSPLRSPEIPRFLNQNKIIKTLEQMHFS